MVTRPGIWELFNDLYDLHRILDQPFFQIICLSLHLFPFNIRCWTFDVRCSFFQFLSHQNNLALMLPCHGSGFPKGMHVNGLYDTGHFTCEAGPAILRIFDPRFFCLIHDDHVARADHLADTAPDACPFINLANHSISSLPRTSRPTNILPNRESFDYPPAAPGTP